MHLFHRPLTSISIKYLVHVRSWLSTTPSKKRNLPRKDELRIELSFHSGFQPQILSQFLFHRSRLSYYSRSQAGTMHNHLIFPSCSFRASRSDAFSQSISIILSFALNFSCSSKVEVYGAHLYTYILFICSLTGAWKAVVLIGLFAAHQRFTYTFIETQNLRVLLASILRILKALVIALRRAGNFQPVITTASTCRL